MTDKEYNFISYDDIIDGQDDIPEMVDKGRIKPDLYILQYLIDILQITDEKNAQENFDEIKNNKINGLYKKIHESYNEHNKGKISGNSKGISEDTKWKKEISLVKEKDKIDIFEYIKNKELTIDKIEFMDDDQIVTGLSVELGGVDTGYEDEESPCVFIIPEFVLNEQGHVQPPEEESTWEVEIDQIKTVIVEKTKYIFM